MSSDPDLDHVDRHLLQSLQEDARLTTAQLAERVSLSQSPCWRRIKRLEEAGIISGYHAHLDAKKLGFGVLGFVSLQLENHSADIAQGFERDIVCIPEVMACHNVSGHYDYQVEVVARDLESFADLVRDRIRSIKGVKEIYTSFSLKAVKPAIGLPLE